MLEDGLLGARDHRRGLRVYPRPRKLRDREYSEATQYSRAPSGRLGCGQWCSTLLCRVLVLWLAKLPSLLSRAIDWKALLSAASVTFNDKHVGPGLFGALAFVFDYRRRCMVVNE